MSTTSTTTTAVPGHDQVERFRAEGYTTIEPLISPTAVEGLRKAYTEILDKEVDCGQDDRQLGGITRQIMSPRLHHADVRDNEVFAAARTVAKELLGCDGEPDYLFDMMIYKPPGHPEETPWHQDFSYFQRPFTPAGEVPVNATVQFWVALDDADPDNGCMHFIPSAHEGPMREHYVHSGDPDYEGRLLAIRDPETCLDLASAVACPLAPGGATVHCEGTPHYTPPNRTTDRGRRAYIINFVDAPRMAAAGKLG